MANIRLSDLMRPYAALLALAVAALLVEGVAGLLEPWPLKVILDQVVGAKPAPAWLARWRPDGQSHVTLLYIATAAVMGIALLSALSSYTERYLSTTIAKRIGFDLRHALYHHVQRLSLSFYERRRTGDMVVRLTADIESVEDFISGAVLGVVLDVVMLTGMMAVMFYLDWRLSLIGLSIAPVLFVVVFRFMRRIKKATREVKQAQGELANVVQESIASARVVKVYAREAFEEERLDRQSRAGVDAALRARRVKARLAPLVDIIVATATCLILIFGAGSVSSGQLTAGALVVYVFYLGKMYKPIKDLSKTADAFSKASVAFERIGEILSIERQVTDRPDARLAPRFEGRIAFDHVTFGYNRTEPVLRDASLVVEPNQRAALVGPTGSGKSTLIALIPRLYDALGGSVQVDGRDVGDYTLQSLREQISFVLQDTVLFHGSVAENIAYGRPGATRSEIVRASSLAHADEFIDRMHDGYDTVLGERGETLSGGQRQRIAIARALIRDSPILLLDEPSSSLDPESEELIFEGLSTLLKGRTSITIAHRLATVRRADVTFVLCGGTIVETGTHDELLKRNGYYARFHRLQFSAGAARTVA